MGYRYLPECRPELLAVVKRIYDARGDLRSIADDSDSLAYWRWVNVSGSYEYAEVRELLPPIPPAELRNVVNIGGEQAFLDAGGETLEALDGVLRRCGTSLRDTKHILDFGCGCGRTIRWLLPYSSTAEIHGCDVDARAITWCQSNLPFARTIVNGEEPPLPYPDGSFDFVYLTSIFSHLEEDNHLRWLQEVHRIAAKGALVVISTHGRRAVEQLVADPTRMDQISVARESLPRLRDELERHGHVFFRQEDGRMNPELYGLAFISPEYVRRVWTKYFEIADYDAGRIHDWQDVITLRAS